MRAVAYRRPLPITEDEALVNVELQKPTPRGHDLLVEVAAVSVNPVDTKIRRNAVPEGSDWRVLGWDAAGTVVAAGPEARLFKPGDRVFYAGSIARPGTNAEFHLVDERIVGRKPATLGFAEAAALPLTAITAWETLFDRLDVRRPVPGQAPAILIVGGAGGVGSIAIQLARQLTELTVIATASRPETAEWCQKLGAHHVLDHSKPLAAEWKAAGLPSPSFVFSVTHSDKHWPAVAEMIAPQGRFALIDDPPAFDVRLVKRKSVSIHWEFMFTRPVFETADLEEQHRLLTEVARLVDAGTIRSTLTENFGPINAMNLKRAHALLESGIARGKVVLEGF